MTKKDYVAIASGMKYLKPGNPVGPPAEHQVALRARIGLWNDTLDELAKIFAADNPRFDRARFFKACGQEMIPCDLLKEIEG